MAARTCHCKQRLRTVYSEQEMHDHPTDVDAQQRRAENVAYTTPEHADEHTQSEEDGERHIQQEDGAIRQRPLPEQQRQRDAKREIDTVAAKNLLNESCRFTCANQVHRHYEIG